MATAARPYEVSAHADCAKQVARGLDTQRAFLCWHRIVATPVWNYGPQRMILEAGECVQFSHFVPKRRLVPFATILEQLGFARRGSDMRSALPGEHKIHQTQIILSSPPLVTLAGIIGLDPPFGAVKRAHITVHAKFNPPRVGLTNVRRHELWDVSEAESTVPT